MCSDECCPPVRPDETERAALVERITDALVRFDREQYEGYTGRAWPDDKHRLSRIARVNDAQHAAWAAQQHYAEMRRAAADELSREGQAMELDEPKPEIDWHSAYVSVVGRAARAKYLEAELAETRTAMDAFHRSAAAMRRDRDRLSAGLRGMALRLSYWRQEAKDSAE